MFVIKYRKIFYTCSLVLIAFSLFSISYWGLNFGIDFKGGSSLEIAYTGVRPTQSAVEQLVSSTGVGEATVRPEGTDSYIIETRTLSEAEAQSFTATLLSGSVSGSEVGSTTASTTGTSIGSTAELKQFNTVGPVLGEELQNKAAWSIVLVILAIVLFITFAFRGVSKPVASWKYGIVAIIALAHDVIIPTGIFAFLGRNGGFEIDALFVTAILVILGFSVHDTIVVFDRTRENLKHDGGSKKPFEMIVGESVSQTFSRSINTSLTTILALVALYVFGPESTQMFALALMIGIAVGTYSSIFIGSPLLVTLQKFQKGE